MKGILMVPDGEDRVKLMRGWLRLEEGRIAEVALEREASAADAGLPLITPGLIDAHAHLPQFDIIGAHGMPLLNWLEQVTFPTEARWADADFAQAMVERVVDQFVAHGTTGILAYSTVHHEATRRALSVCERRGLRAAVGQALIDQEAPDTMLRPRQAALDETDALLTAWPWRGGQARVSAVVTPRFAITCSAELMAQAGALAAEHGSPIQTHLAETRPELAAVEALHGGPHYVGVYDRASLVTERAVFGHCIYLSDDELALMASRGAVAAHCPTANSFLRSGTMDRARLVEAGVRVAVGSDVGGGYERSMVRVGRAMIEATFFVGRDPLAASTAWWHITAGNADALGWADSGRLVEGAEADLLVIEPDIPWLSAADPLGMLMFAWDDRWLRQTWLAGKVAFAGPGA